MSQKTSHSADRLSTNALEIILTGPFQTGNPLDFSQTKTDEYRKIQEAVRDKMEEVFPFYVWEIPKSGGGQKYEMSAGGTGKAHSPSYYLECIMDCKKIKCKFNTYNFTIRKMKIKFYEFGFATASIFGRISLKGSSKKVSSSDLLCIVNDLDEKIVSGEAQKIKALISNVTKKFDKTIRENKIKKFFANEKTSNEKANISIGNIVSLHRIFRYKVGKKSEIKVAQEALDKIAKLSNGEWQEEHSFSHFAGIANSAIVYNQNVSNNRKSIDGKILNQYKEAYETVLETANAYYFIAEFIKNRLFDYSRESVAIKKSKYIFKIFKNRKKSKEVEKGLNNFILLSSNFSSTFDEFIINLSPQGKDIWTAMDKAWNTSNTVQMLKDQLQNSLLITGEILGQESNKLQSRLNYTAVIFTAIGAISLVEISQSDGFHWKEIFIIQGYMKNFGDFVSKGVNLIGSVLAVILVVIFGLLFLCAIIVLLLCLLKKLINLFKKFILWILA